MLVVASKGRKESSEGLDLRVVDEIAESIEDIGQIEPGVKAKEDGMLVSGRHRKAAAEKKGVRFLVYERSMEPLMKHHGISLEMAKMVFRVRANIRHDPSADNAAIILKAAQMLAVDMPAHKVSARIVEIFKISRTTVDKVLPDIYKDMAKARTRKTAARHSLEDERWFAELGQQQQQETTTVTAYHNRGVSLGNFLRITYVLAPRDSPDAPIAIRRILILNSRPAQYPVIVEPGCQIEISTTR